MSVAEGIAYVPCEQVSIKTLMDGGVPLRLGLNEEPLIYQKLASLKMKPFIAKDGRQIRFLVQCPNVDGWGVNALLYAAAPNKSFGFDTRDITNDWYDLYNDPRNRARLEAHRRMPNWSVFEKERELIRMEIQKGSRTRKRPPYRQNARSFIPVMQWEVGEDGSKKWNFDLSPESAAILARPIERVGSKDKVSPLLGLLYNAAYSPDITNHTWPTRRGYTSQGRESQSMGPTQVLPLALIHAQELLFSRLVTSLETYCESTS